jgi:predicted nucleotidyltransferase
MNVSAMVELEHKESIIKIITAFYPDAKIYLFGSYARGTAKQGSDIDIAIDTGRRLNLHEWQFLWNLLDALPTVQKIDLVDMHRIPEAMQKSILKDGVVWKP